MPTLQLLQDDQSRRSRDVVESVAKSLQLTDEDRAETIPSGQPVHMNRAHWAMSHMFHAGLIERPSRGVVKISQAGRDAFHSAAGLQVVLSFTSMITGRPSGSNAITSA